MNKESKPGFSKVLAIEPTPKPILIIGLAENRLKGGEVLGSIALPVLFVRGACNAKLMAKAGQNKSS